jgi:hypothetical protein
MHKKTAIIIIIVLSIAVSIAYAMGISTAFGRIKIDNIKTGQTYSMKDDAGMMFEVRNTSDMEITLKIKVLKPLQNELIEGYEPIPDAEWISLEKDLFTLEPEGSISTDIKISIPQDPSYKGKKYQANIWSHTTGLLAVGLKSKLLIKIANEE